MQSRKGARICSRAALSGCRSGILQKWSACSKYSLLSVYPMEPEGQQILSEKTVVEERKPQREREDSGRSERIS
jgi:hypothetical protein